jgi:hypothetical protein
MYPVQTQQFYLLINQQHVSANTVIIRLCTRVKRKYPQLRIHGVYFPFYSCIQPAAGRIDKKKVAD